MAEHKGPAQARACIQSGLHKSAIHIFNINPSDRIPALSVKLLLAAEDLDCALHKNKLWLKCHHWLEVNHDAESKGRVRDAKCTEQF